MNMNESDPLLADVLDRLLNLLGELAPEERLELQGSLREGFLALFRVDGLPTELAVQLGSPLARGMPLDVWCRERATASRFAEDAFTPLRTAAALVDHWAATDRPLLAFLPAACQVDEEGRLCVQGPRLDLGRFNPAIRQLTEYQRKYAKKYLHTNLLRTVENADLASAGVYSFALFLLNVFLGIQAPTRAELQDALEKCPHRPGQAIPPDLPVLFRQVVTASSKKPLGWTCQDLLSAVLRSYRDNPFACKMAADPAVSHRRFAYSVQGLHKEGGNEDRHYSCHQGPASLLLVADGVSTADLGSGAIAAEEIVRLMEFGYKERFQAAVEAGLRASQAWPEAAGGFLTDLFGAAHQKVVEQVNTLYHNRKESSQPPQSPMCSTLTAAFVWGDQALIHHLGDSPAWLFSPSRNLFCKLTADHHAARERDFSFELDRQATALTRVIGACEFSLELQGFLAIDQSPACVRVQLQRGDLLLVASDGLIEAIDESGTQEKVARFEAELRQLAQTEKDLKRLVRRLVALAEDGLSNDNITLNALRIEPKEEAHG
jgi:serine/threonine protein phosphatase PrpC